MLDKAIHSLNFNRFYRMLRAMLLEERDFGLVRDKDRMFSLPALRDIASVAIEVIIREKGYAIYTNTFLWIVDYGEGYRIDESYEEDRDSDIEFQNMTPEVIAQVHQRLIGLLEIYIGKLNELFEKSRLNGESPQHDDRT